MVMMTVVWRGRYLDSNMQVFDEKRPKEKGVGGQGKTSQQYTTNTKDEKTAQKKRMHLRGRNECPLPLPLPPLRLAALSLPLLGQQYNINSFPPEG